MIIQLEINGVYSSMSLMLENDISNEKMTRVIYIVKEILNVFLERADFDDILVGGCGMGLEASIISDVFKARKTLGVDISIPKDIIINDHVSLKKQSLMDLSIYNGTFSLIYSYHVLEHVSNPKKALLEMHRALKNNGVLFIGFPNRNRLIGNIGSYHNYTKKQKIRQNLIDYGQKIRGRFRNEYGAHAGFTEREFLANNIFSEVIPVRNHYFLKKYESKKLIINIIIKTGLSEFLFPSNYFICKK